MGILPMISRGMAILAMVHHGLEARATLLCQFENAVVVGQDASKTSLGLDETIRCPHVGVNIQ